MKREMVLNMYWKITKQRILMLTFPQIQQQSRQIHLSISCIKGNHYSSYYKLLKHIAWILNLKQNYISYKGSKEHKGLPFTNLNMQDIDCTENKILKHCQLKFLKMNLLIWLKVCLLKLINWFLCLLFLKNGLVPVGGRIGSAYIPCSSKHQVIIFNNQPIASLLLFYIHVTNFHSERDLTLNLLRESY